MLEWSKVYYNLMFLLKNVERCPKTLNFSPELLRDGSF